MESVVEAGGGATSVRVTSVAEDVREEGMVEAESERGKEEGMVVARERGRWAVGARCALRRRIVSTTSPCPCDLGSSPPSASHRDDSRVRRTRSCSLSSGASVDPCPVSRGAEVTEYQG